MTRAKLILSQVQVPSVPAPLVEETVLSPVKRLGALVESQLTVLCICRLSVYAWSVCLSSCQGHTVLFAAAL